MVGSPNNCIRPTHFRSVSFVANATSLTPLQWSADASRWASDCWSQGFEDR